MKLSSTKHRTPTKSARKHPRHVRKSLLRSTRQDARFSFSSQPFNAIPLLDLDDFFTTEPTPSIPTYTPQTIHTAPTNITKNVITLITKPCCSLCVPAYETIKKNYLSHPNTFHYMEIDLDDERNLEFRGRYKYTIPVVLVNGNKFSNKKFTEDDALRLGDIIRNF